jgi:protein-disulfide isomerase
MVFRAVLNHGERSERASEAAACAGRQGQFWAMHEMLFKRQRELWGQSGQALLDLLGDMARTLPLSSPADFSRCVTERSTIEALRAADAEQRRRGIWTQPVFEIGGRRIFGVQSVEVMAQAIDFALP